MGRLEVVVQVSNLRSYLHASQRLAPRRPPQARRYQQFAGKSRGFRAEQIDYETLLTLDCIYPRFRLLRLVRPNEGRTATQRYNSYHSAKECRPDSRAAHDIGGEDWRKSRKGWGQAGSSVEVNGRGILRRAR